MNRLNPDKRCIFRQVFNSQDDIDNNPYCRPTIVGTVKFKDGYAYTESNDSCILLDQKLKFHHMSMSYRFKFKLNISGGLGFGRVCVFKNGQGTKLNDIINGYKYTSEGTSLALFYVNGKLETASTYLFQQNVEYDVVIVGSIAVSYPNYSLYQLLWSYNGGSIYCKLFDLYNVALSATEIKNLYENKKFLPLINGSEFFHLNAYKGILDTDLKVAQATSSVLIQKKSVYLSPNNVFSGFGIKAYIGQKLKYTYSMWCKMNSFKEGTYFAWTLNSGRGFAYLAYPQQGGIIISVTMGPICGQVNTVLGNNTEILNKYCHFVHTFDNGTYKYYFNGTLKNTIIAGDQSLADTIIDLSKYNYSGTYYKNIRMFNDVFTDQEVNQIYTSEKKLFNL